MGKKRSVILETTFHTVRKNRFQAFESDSEEDVSTPLAVVEEREQKGVSVASGTSGSEVGSSAKQLEPHDKVTGQVEELRNRWAGGQTATEFPNFFSRGLRHVTVASPITWDVPMFLDEERFPASEGSPSVFPVLSIPKQSEPYVQGRFPLTASRSSSEELLCRIQDTSSPSYSAGPTTDAKEEKTFAMRIKESLDAVEKEKHAQNLEKNHTSRVEAIRSSLTQLSFFRNGAI